MRFIRSFTSSTCRCLPRRKTSPDAALLDKALARASDHHDLSSFLAYAEQASLSQSSTTFVGTHYEYTVLGALRRLGFDLVRTGGSGDRGVDLKGKWHLPSVPDDCPLNIYIQCKALARKPGPSVIRELEGAIGHLQPTMQLRRDNAAMLPDAQQLDSHGLSIAPQMGFLVATLGATKAMQDAMARSRLALGFAKINQDGVMEQLLWNRAASDQGLEGIGVVTQYGDTTKQISLTWKGQLWPTP